MNKEIEKKWIEFSNELALPKIFFPNFTYWYSHPERAYHNLNHINDCLNEFEDAKHLAKNCLELKTAIWFHEVIYNPKSENNEEESAKLACLTLKEKDISDDFIETVYNLILATKHDKIPKDIDSQLITDIDLSIFGQPAEKFYEYEAAIREEYNYLSEEEFKMERCKIFRKFLSKSNIYSTEFFREKYKLPARENLFNSLKEIILSS